MFAVFRGGEKRRLCTGSRPTVKSRNERGEKEMGLQGIIRKRSMLKSLTVRLSSGNLSSSTALFVEPLKNRRLLRVVGSEVHDYLQGLITNDMNQLNGVSECMYALFLNGRGRVLYDTIVYRTNKPNTYIVEGDSSAVNCLKKHLLLYKVRRKISVECADDLNLWVVNNNFDLRSTCNNSMKAVSQILKSLLDNCLVCCDPRIPELGFRIVAPRDMNVTCVVGTIPGYQVVSKNFYNSLRYRLGVGEGIAELIPGHTFPMEANCDYLCGVSFHKGCYIGQELTARTHHTGVVRKRLMPITFTENLNLAEKDIPIFLEDDNERAVGKLKGVEGSFGIALLRINEVLKSPKLRMLGKSCTTTRPLWWPVKGDAQ